ncbi:MAG: sugar phosphate isomerase/epimerase [Pseudomonadota bacterium]
MTAFGFQLYTARSVSSLPAFLAHLSKLGYAHVEGFGDAYADPRTFRAALDASGLRMPSGHFGVHNLRDDFAGCAHIASVLGVKTLIAPWLDPGDRPEDTEGYKALARNLSALSKRCANAGFGFAWHNHAFEFEKLRGGAVGLDVLLNEAPDLMWEADLAWIVRGGADADLFLDRYAERITALHVKDLAPYGENADEDGWADLGSGVMDWPHLITRVRREADGALMIAEHDKPASPGDFATSAIAAFRDWTRA